MRGQVVTMAARVTLPVVATDPLFSNMLWICALVGCPMMRRYLESIRRRQIKRRAMEYLVISKCSAFCPTRIASLNAHGAALQLQRCTPSGRSSTILVHSIAALSESAHWHKQSAARTAGAAT